MRRRALPLLALVGVAGVLLVWWRDRAEPTKLKPVIEPAQAPFESYVAASGLVEAPTKNLAVATSVPGIVKQVYVKAGQQVRAGEPLFQIDDAIKRAELARQRISLELAEEKIRKLNLGSRPEEVGALEARVAEARVALEDARRQLELRRKLGGLVSANEVLQQQADTLAKEQQLNFAVKQLELSKAGAWQPDIEIARTEAAAVRSQLTQIQMELDQMIVRAPVSGEILQINVHPGEFATTTASQAPVVLGETRRLNIRAEVDENDAWRIEESRPAKAFPRGRRDVLIPLRFVRIEPYVNPKRNLTGESAERVDTRVLSVIYELQSPPIRLFVGQQMDVYIEAPPLVPAGAPAVKPAPATSMESAQ